MVCGDGADTGLGINPGTDPTRLVIVVQGGGACWDLTTCLLINAASHVTAGWGAGQMAAETATLQRSVWFDRDAADPWSDATWALTPYCTDDLHAGNRVQVYNVPDPSQLEHHAGDSNLVAAPGGERLGDWVEAWRDGHPAWTDAR